MGKYVIKRLLLLIPILLGVSFIILTIMNMIPGDVASLVLGDNAPLSARQELTRELGLDKPFWLRYVDYVWNAVHGNFGLSYRTRTPVFTEIFSRFPTTMKLAAGAMLLSVAIGVPLGILSAVKQYSALDVINSVTAMFFSSIPAFWLGLLSILLFALKLGWLPSNGADTMKSFILPIVTLALPGVGTLAMDAIRSKDTPQVMAAVLMLAALFCIIMLIVDLLYAFIDPRIRSRYSK